MCHRTEQYYKWKTKLENCWSFLQNTNIRVGTPHWTLVAHIHTHSHTQIYSKYDRDAYAHILSKTQNIRIHLNRNMPRYNSRYDEEQPRIYEFQNKKCEVNIPSTCCVSMMKHNNVSLTYCDVSISILELQQP